MFRSVMAVALALSMSACASALQRTTTGEHIAVQGVHIIIGSEEKAYQAGAISVVQHQNDKLVLTKIVQAEKALNDALTTWNTIGNTGVMPTQVTEAVKGLTQLLIDLQPLVSTDPTNTINILTNQLANVIAALTQGGN